MSPDIDKPEEQDLLLDEHHRALVEEGIRQADAGQLIPHSEVVKFIAERSRTARARSAAES
jgi:predicted transcriptional regulator